MRRIALVFVVLGAVLPSTAAALKGPAPWVSRHGLTSSKYQAEFEKWGKAGYRLQQVSGYVDGGTVKYAALWRKLSGPPWVAKHGLTSAKYQKAFDDYGKQGYRLVWVDGYTVGGTPYFAAIWEKKSGPAWQAFHNLTASDYQSTFDKLTKKGWRQTHISGYTAGSSPRFAVIFEKTTGPAGVTHPAMSASQYQANYNKYIGQGFNLKEVSGYYVPGVGDRYAAIWEKSSPGQVLRARNGISLSSYQRVSDTDYYQGYYPTYIQAFTSGSSVRFNTINLTPISRADIDKINKAMNDVIKRQRIAGVQIAIAKNGKLLYSSGFGKADVESNIALDVDHRLRIGSISKTLTSVAAYKLLGVAGMSRKVFGPQGILPGVAVPPRMKSLEDATVAQFLMHQSGLPGAGAGFNCQTTPGPCNLQDPVNCSAGSLEGRIAAELKRFDDENKAKGVPSLIGKPGEHDDYSNFSHNIIEAVIEKLIGDTTGHGYGKYVVNKVLGPMGLPTSGIFAPALFHIGPYDASLGEPKFYLAGSAGGGDYAEYSSGGTCEEEPPGTGAGGWAMSAKQLLQYYVNVDGASPREFFPLATWQDMLKIVPTTDGKTTSYAKSWATGGVAWCGVGRTVLSGHNGGLSGGFAQMWGINDGYSFTLIGNQNHATSKTAATGSCTHPDSAGKSIPCGGPGMYNCEDDPTAVLLSDIIGKVTFPDWDLFG